MLLVLGLAESRWLNVEGIAVESLVKKSIRRRLINFQQANIGKYAANSIGGDIGIEGIEADEHGGW